MLLLDAIHGLSGEMLVLAPDDPGAEVANNTHWLAASAQQRAGLSVAQIVSAFESTTEALRRQVQDSGYRGTATFYVWHDIQAGQLRCSVSSRTADALPFVQYRPTDDLTGLVAEFLSDASPGRVLWDDLRGTDSPGDEPMVAPVQVWTCAIGAQL